MKFPPELYNPYSVLVKINPPTAITNIDTKILRKLKRLKPKKVLIEKAGLVAKHHPFKKPIIQVRSVLIRRLLKGYYNRISEIRHHVPDKGRHRMFVGPVSARFISYLLYRRIKLPQLKHIIPQYVNTAILFHKHLIVPAVPTIHAVFVRLVPEKPNCAILVVLNLLPTTQVLKIYHLDHPNAKGTKPLFDIVTLPPMSMLVFVHFVDKNDPIVKFHITLHKIRKERKKQLRKLYKETLEQLKPILSQVEILP